MKTEKAEREAAGIAAGKTTLAKLKKGEREARKELIMEACARLFETRSFHEIGMRDIAAEAGLSPASIYRYFESREDLFVEMLVQDIARIEKLLYRRVEEGRSSIEELAVAVVDYLLDNEATFQVMCHFSIRGEMNPQALTKFHAVQQQFLDMFDALLGQAGGNSTEKLYTAAFFASLAGVVMICRNYPGYGPDEKRELMHQLALMTLL